MATRSRIGIMLPSGSIKSIYCHNDGYPEGVGRTLKSNYTNPDDISRLIDQGDTSFIDENGTSHPYGDSEPRIDENYATFMDKIGQCGEEYTYLFMEDWTGVFRWHVTETPCMVEL